MAEERACVLGTHDDGLGYAAATEAAKRGTSGLSLIGIGVIHTAMPANRVIPTRLITELTRDS